MDEICLNFTQNPSPSSKVQLNRIYSCLKDLYRMWTLSDFHIFLLSEVPRWSRMDLHVQKRRFQIISDVFDNRLPTQFPLTIEKHWFWAKYWSWSLRLENRLIFIKISCFLLLNPCWTTSECFWTPEIIRNVLPKLQETCGIIGFNRIDHIWKFANCFFLTKKKFCSHPIQVL